MKKLAIALSAVAALFIGISAQAETINYDVTGWQTTCSNTYAQGTSTNCLYPGTKKQGRLSGGTITGTAQFIGDSTNGGTLTVTSSIYVTTSTGGVGPATINSSSWFGLTQYGDPNGLNVTTGGEISQTCSPTSDTICQTANTPLAVANIDIYGPGNTVGGTLKYMVNALASSSANMAWQEFTLTVVPEPGTALLLGAGLLGLAISGRRRK